MEKGFEKIEKDIESKFAERPLMVEGVEGKEEITENKEEKEAREEIVRELKKSALPQRAKTQAQKQADDIQDQSEQGKVQRLLELAQTQGLAYAVEVVKKMNSPLLLDKFHDALVEDKIFKKYLQK
ncbi:hypothetical protein KAW43_00730 [Candidatus Parcubacteria bacterium]|nr:hypothetical protein [Candidatus Parcubacteria bacterium]